MVKKYIKNSITILAIALTASTSLGQVSEVLEQWNDSTLILANTASDVNYMTQKEKQVIFYINLARNNPDFFHQTIVSFYLDSANVKKDKYVKELIATLKSTSPMEMLKPAKDLWAAANKHATDMGETGRTGHNASDGSTFSDRMGFFSQTYQSVNENCNYGLETALDIVMDLLIDQGISNAGHRKNILNPESRFVGVSIQPHMRYGVNCVQDFAGPRL